MNTYEATLTADAWTEILGGKTTVGVDVAGQARICLTFTETDEAPAIDAPYVRVETFPHGFDYYASGQKTGQRIWARALSGAVEVVVTR